MNDYDAYPVRPRAAVKAACPSPVMDDRKLHFKNPNTSSALYGVTTGRYTILAVRTKKQNEETKLREEAAIDRSFAYEGLGVRRSGRNSVVDKDAGAGRPERDDTDEAVRTGGVNRPRPAATPRSSTYSGNGTKLTTSRNLETKVLRKAPGARRATLVGHTVAAQMKYR